MFEEFAELEAKLAVLILIPLKNRSSISNTKHIFVIRLVDRLVIL